MKQCCSIKGSRNSSAEDINSNNIKLIYHITSASHLPTILKHGILSHDEAYRKRLIKEDISMAGVQNRRSQIIIDDKPLHNYACLYFSTTNPMLFKVQIKYGDIVIIAVDA